MKSAKNSLGILAIICLSIAIFFVYSRCQEEESAKTSKAGALMEKRSEISNGKCEQNDLTPVSTALGLQKVIIILAVKDNASYEKVKKAVQDVGGKLTVGIPPERMLALIPPEKESQLKSLKEIRIVTSKPVQIDNLNEFNDKEKKLLKQWNKKLSQTTEPTLIHNPPPPPNDAFERSPINLKEIEVKPPKYLPSGMGDGGSFLLQNNAKEISPAATGTMSGKVVVAIFLPESNGAIDPNQENWTSTQRDNVNNEIGWGVDWWATLAPGSQALNFEIVLYEPTNPCMSISYEPITRPQTDEGLWINQIMTCLGYTSGSYFTKVDSFNTWLKSARSAKEAYSVFVVDDDVDSDNYFSDGHFAYAYLGGPFVVMTYDNDNYGISWMEAVHAHEHGHIFNAYDEYAGAWSCDETSDCTLSYRGCPNQNCVQGCSFNVCCIMRSQITPYTSDCICDCTKGQIGWGCGTCGGSTCNYTLNSPSGGENWIIGNGYTISWTSSGSDCGANVKLEYSTNGGSSWTTITSSTANDGSYPWTIPNAPTTQARVRVTDTANSSYWDQSDSNFVISSTPSDCLYNLNSPNGGENWLIGANNHNITWYTSGNNCYNIDANTIAFWHFNEGSGTSINDSSGNNYNGTAVNIAWTGSGKCGNAITSSSSSKITIPDSVNFTIPTPFTFEIWIYPTSTGQGMSLIDKQYWGGLDIGITSDKKIYIYIESSDGIGSTHTTTNALIAANQWQNISITYSGSSLKIYKNFGLVQSWSENRTLGDTTYDMGIGYDVYRNDSKFIGYIDEVRFSNIARQYSNSCGSNVMLEYSINGGSSWNTITTSTANDGSEPWTIPNSPTSQARVKVTDTSNSSYWDQSDSNFMISQATCTCSSMPNCCFTDSLTISSGASYIGDLTTSDAQDGSGRYYDDIEFCGTSGQGVTIDMYSTAFDTYLVLYGPSSCTAAVISDDDSGYGLNSRISFTLNETGTWTIKATSYSASVTGAYTIWLNGSIPCTSDSQCQETPDNTCTTDTCELPGYSYSYCTHSPQCASGPCCNTSIGCFNSVSYKCQENVTTSYACFKGKPHGKCGDDVYEQHQDRYCSGSSTSCDGALQYDSWTRHQACSRKQVCVSSSHRCKRKAMCISSSSSSAISSEQLDQEEEGQFYDFSSSTEEKNVQDSEEASPLIANAPDKQDLSSEQANTADGDKGEGRFGCMMTSGRMDSGEIGSMAVIYGLPILAVIYMKIRIRRRR